MLILGASKYIRLTSCAYNNTHCILLSTYKYIMHSIMYIRVQSASWYGLIRPLLCTQKYLLECCELKSTLTILLCKVWRH